MPSILNNDIATIAFNAKVKLDKIINFTAVFGTTVNGKKQ